MPIYSLESTILNTLISFDENRAKTQHTRDLTRFATDLYDRYGSESDERFAIKLCKFKLVWQSRCQMSEEDFCEIVYIVTQWRTANSHNHRSEFDVDSIICRNWNQVLKRTFLKS